MFTYLRDSKRGSVIKRFNHVGIAVKDLDSAIEFFEKTYGAKLIWRKRFEDQKIESAFVSIGEAKFELTASLNRRASLPSLLRTEEREFIMSPWRLMSLTR